MIWQGYSLPLLSSISTTAPIKSGLEKLRVFPRVDGRGAGRVCLLGPVLLRPLFRTS